MAERADTARTLTKRAASEDLTLDVAELPVNVLDPAPTIFSAFIVATREVPTFVAVPPLLSLHDMGVEPMTRLNTAEDDVALHYLFRAPDGVVSGPVVGFHERLQRIPRAPIDNRFAVQQILFEQLVPHFSQPQLLWPIVAKRPVQIQLRASNLVFPRTRKAASVPVSAGGVLDSGALA